MRRAALGLVAGFALSVTAGAGSNARASDGYALVYDVFVGGLHLGAVEASLRIEDERYAFTLVGAPRGIAAVFSNAQYAAGAVGPLGSGPVGDGAMPETFAVLGRWGGEERVRTVDFEPDGSIEVFRDPDEDEIETDPIPDDMLVDVLDPLSAGLTLILALNRGEQCIDNVPVFDGERRYDLTFTSRGETVLPPSRRNVYDGPAITCLARMVPLAGAWIDREDDEAWDEEDYEQRQRDFIRIYFASPIEGGLLLPVRGEGEGRRGAIFIHLSEIRPLDAGERVELPVTSPRI